MPKLTIDNIEVEVPEGTNVLEAAKKVGIVIPHFCYHPALGSVGACRLCAMKFVEGPVKGVQVSCMIQAADGMVVSTTDGEAARLRRLVIEWLMENHPHDCPVCDEGGMCLLQDYTVSGGHGIRRYKGKKRTFTDQYLGEFIQHEMNRCIQCYRCARFYQDYAGGEDFGPMQLANKVYFGRFREGWLESPFSGNLADVCPTGVLTDRTFRFKARVWDLESSPSVCPHCSLGCNVTPGGRYRELLRVVAKENPEVNGWFICDRGRFGYGFASRNDRPYRPGVQGAGASREEALKNAADSLFTVTEAHGGGAVAFLGSPRASVETNYALGKLARALGSKNVCYSTDPGRAARESAAVSHLKNGLSRPLGEIQRSDAVLVLGVDPLNEAPMLALALRQAYRNGAKVFVVDPRPVELPMEFTHIPVPLAKLGDKIPPEAQSALEARRQPTIIAGTGLAAPGIVELAASTAERLKDTGSDSGLYYVMSGPNSYGTALMSESSPDFNQILDGISAGRIKALVVAEADPAGYSPDAKVASAALSKLDALIVLDYLPTKTANMADVFIPSRAYAEDDGVFVNGEGRAQAYAKAYETGLPINSMGPEAHPPREFFSEIPGGTPPTWRTMLELICTLRPECPLHDGAVGLRAELAASDPVWEPLASIEAGGTGAVLNVPAGFEPAGRTEYTESPGDGIVLVAADTTFGTEELSSYSDKINLRAPEPYIVMNTAQAEDLGLEPGRTVVVEHDTAGFECVLRVSDAAARGTAFTPRLFGRAAWELSGKTVKIRMR